MDGWMDEPAVELPVTGFILFVGPVTNLRQLRRLGVVRPFLSILRRIQFHHSPSLLLMEWMTFVSFIHVRSST